jgi:hypothetical protein
VLVSACGKKKAAGGAPDDAAPGHSGSAGRATARTEPRPTPPEPPRMPPEPVVTTLPSDDISSKSLDDINKGAGAQADLLRPRQRSDQRRRQQVLVENAAALKNTTSG